MSDYLEREAEMLEAPWTGDWHGQREVYCNNCKKHICYAYPFDIEGSIFYCDECFSRRAEIAKEIREKIAFEERNKDTVRTYVDGVDKTEWK